MRTADYDYDLPEELIAQHPAVEREGARLMVLDRKAQSIVHQYIRDLPAWLEAGDVLVLNNTRVFPARLRGSKATGGRVEILFIEESEDGIWDVLMRASRRPRPGASFTLAEGQVEATVVAHGERGAARVRIRSDRPLRDLLEEEGEVPLPPYIRRAGGDGEERDADRERYQTVYARHSGAVAAPTAGLHFSEALFRRLEAMGVEKTFVTLHVGPGTFQPVTAERVEDHRMHAERYEVSPAAVEAIRHRRGRCVAVGSTSVRTLESATDEAGHLVAGSGSSRLFIYPPYRFRAVDAMLTNFHLPQSTLLMMVCALGGKEFILRAYAEAVRLRYRFFSYGDAMLIL